jgi:hypothetical protein
MKTRLASVLILAAALSSSALIPLSAASKNNAAIGYPVRLIDLPSCGQEQIARGATQGMVSRLMGSPLRELAPDVWVYRGYHADLDLANDQGCDIIVVTFTKGKVTDLKLVNQSAVSILMAKSQSKPAERYASLK